jgi:hypothetical protein
MNLDDLMAVWRSQDVAPLHGVNETLLRLALRQDEATLQAQRRLQSRTIYVMSAALILGMGTFALMIFAMLFYNDDDVITGWDFAIPIVGATAALLMSVALYRTRRAQAQREQPFGESVRDQLGRRIAQLDDQATTAVRLQSMLLVAICVCGTAMLLAGIRVNMEPTETFNGGGRVVRLILVFAFIWSAGVWAARRSVNRDVLPRKRRLETLLKEIEREE